MDFEQNLNRLQLKDLIKVAQALSKSAVDLTVRTYQPLLEFVQRSAEPRDQTALLGIAHAVYGWMPTMLNFNVHTPISDFWESVSAGSLEELFLDSLRKSVNNSVVGASKVLHFLNPADYAIFDSRVYWGIVGEASYDYRVNNVSHFVLYTQRLRQLAGENLDDLRDLLESKRMITPSTSNLRALEVCLYHRNSLPSVLRVPTTKVS